MNLDRIEAVLQLLARQQHVEEVQVDAEGWRLAARRLPGLPPMPESPGPATEDAPPRPHVIQAPLVGVFRAPPGPLTPGQYLARGAAVGAIDSMRILNPVLSEESGWVEEILVEDGDPVEFGQSLFVLSPDGAAKE